MHATLTLVIELLLIAAVVGLLAKRLQVHYNVALVLAGVGVGAMRLLPPVALDADIVLQVFLPILLFEAAIATDLRRLRELLAPVMLLAVPGMLATVAVAGLVLAAGLGIGWSHAFLLGAILAGTDTIAVIAGFRRVRAPGRLTALVENESLWNDATALVAYSTILGVIASGVFSPLHSLANLAWVAGAGLGVGWTVGMLAVQVMRRTHDHLMELLLTVIVTYGSWQLAERIHASPIIAVVSAGIVIGTLGWEALAATGRVAIRSFWEVAAFGVNSVVFLLIGLQVDFPSLLAAAPAIGIGLLALTLGRIAAVYPFLGLARLWGSPTPLRWQHLLVWGNLKGGLSMALVLSLPPALAHRELMTAVVYGCALVTLTVQGLSLAPLARWLGLGRMHEASRRIEEQQVRLLAARAGQSELERMQRLGLLPGGTFQRMRATYQGVITRSERQMRDVLARHAEEETRQTEAVRRHLLTVEKSAIRDAVGSGIVSDAVASELVGDIDRVLAEAAAHEEGE